MPQTQPRGPGRGRPFAGGTQPHRAVRVTEADHAALTEIAVREGLLWGGQPAQGLAVRWLIERDGDGAVEYQHSPARHPA